jgi:hypothetical protein
MPFEPGLLRVVSIGKGSVLFMTNDSNFRQFRVGRAAVGANAMGALAVGAFAVGALALGACAIGRLVVGKLMIQRAELKSISIEDVAITRSRVRELTVTDSLIAPDRNPVLSSGQKHLTTFP